MGGRPGAEKPANEGGRGGGEEGPITGRIGGDVGMPGRPGIAPDAMGRTWPKLAR